MSSLCNCGCGMTHAEHQVQVLRKHRLRWEERYPDIPYGTCLCGCGKSTRPAPKTAARNGYVKGAPMWYFERHDLSKEPERHRVEGRGYTSPCWVWTGATRPCNAGHYGHLWHKGKLRSAYRVYYEEARGPIPEGMHLDHLCRVTLCVNPDHLEPVTNAENIQRGRVAKLTPEQVREVRRALAEGALHSHLAERYNISTGTVWSIKTRKSWKNL